MSASFVESGPTCLLEELVGRTYAALREWSPRHCLSGEAEVFVCVCSRVYRAFLWVVVDFWLNNLRTLFSNCERATLVFFFCFFCVVVARRCPAHVGLLLLSTLISIVIFVCRAFLCLKLL